MFGIGFGELILILIVGLIVFGPSKLPELGRSIGSMLKEFRKAQDSLSSSIYLDSDIKPVEKNPADHLTEMINSNPIKLDKEVKS